MDKIITLIFQVKGNAPAGRLALPSPTPSLAFLTSLIVFVKLPDPDCPRDRGQASNWHDPQREEPKHPFTLSELETASTLLNLSNTQGTQRRSDQRCSRIHIMDHPVSLLLLALIGVICTWMWSDSAVNHTEVRRRAKKCGAGACLCDPSQRTGNPETELDEPQQSSDHPIVNKPSEEITLTHTAASVQLRSRYTADHSKTMAAMVPVRPCTTGRAMLV